MSILPLLVCSEQSEMVLLQSDFKRHFLTILLGPAELRSLIIDHDMMSLSYRHYRLIVHAVLTHVLGPDFIGFPRRIIRKG